MAGLPRGFLRGAIVGGIVAALARVMLDRETRTNVTGKVMQGAGAVPFLGSRLYGRFADQLMGEAYRSIADEVVAEARSGELLELGSGAGHLAQEIAQRSRDLQITAMDLSGDMVQMTESRVHGAGLGSQVKVVHGDAMDIPFPSESFDYVLSVNALHNWLAPEIVLREIYRVLKPGGKAWLYDIRKETGEEDWDEVRRQVPLSAQPLFDMGIANAWRTAFSQDEISSFVLKSPFTNPSIAPMDAEIAYLRIPAFTKVTLEKKAVPDMKATTAATEKVTPPPPPPPSVEGTGQEA